MGFNKITAAEAAAFIRNGETIGLSGFTPAGVPKSVPAEIAKKAEKEHTEGKEFKINIFTGASTGQSCDGMLANVHAIKFRAPYTTNKDFRTHVNNNEISYSDLNLSNMATQIRQGYLGQVDWAIIEACEVELVGGKARIGREAAVLASLAAFCTVCFTLLSDVITPLFYGWSMDVAIGYFYTGFFAMVPQTLCAAVSVTLLFYPLERAFFMVLPPVQKKRLEALLRARMARKRGGAEQIPPSNDGRTQKDMV